MRDTKKIFMYILCVLCGIYTADMVYRIIRYIGAVSAGDAFEKTIMLIGTILLDGESFMILSAVCALLIFIVAICGKSFRKRALAVLFINAVSSITFMVASGLSDIEFGTLLYISVIFVPLYLLSGLWCIYFCIKELCYYFMNTTSKEKNK